MLMLFYPHFIEESLRLREVNNLPKVTQPGRGGIRFPLAPKAVILPLFLVLKEIEKGLHGFREQGKIAKVNKQGSFRWFPLL